MVQNFKKGKHIIAVQALEAIGSAWKKGWKAAHLPKIIFHKEKWLRNTVSIQVKVGQV